MNSRRLLLLGGLASMAGCAQRTLPRSMTAPPTSVATTEVPFTTPASPLSTRSTYRYGRFTVRVENDRQTILGGVFSPPREPAFHLVRNSALHVLLVDFGTKELHYYRRTNEVLEPVVGYAVITPPTDRLPTTAVVGTVRRIDLRPQWCPTPAMLRAEPSLPRGCVPFGDPRNMMGKARFEIAWTVPDWEAVRLHGAPGYPAGNFWDTDTFGCVSLLDEAILALIEGMGGASQAVREGILVVFHRLPSTA